MKILKCFLFVSVILLTSCTRNTAETNNLENAISTISETTVSEVPIKTEKASDIEKEIPVEAKITEHKNVIKPTSGPLIKEEVEPQEKETTNINISKETKEYILNGQNDKSEAEKIKWSEMFLDQLDFDSIYQSYLENGGTANEISVFSLYLTSNAPILTNWQDLVTEDLFAKYQEKAIRFELLQDDLYQVFVVIDGSEVPYVVVSSRTGYFHG